MTERLVSADEIEPAVAAYTAHINHENRERRIEAHADRRALVKTDKAIAGIMAALEDGLYQPSMQARMAELERNKAEITARLEEEPRHVPDIHPDIAYNYTHQVETPTATLVEPQT